MEIGADAKQVDKEDIREEERVKITYLRTGQRKEGKGNGGKVEV